jgi:hypothetical protein
LLRHVCFNPQGLAPLTFLLSAEAEKSQEAWRKKMTTDEVARLSECALVTVQKWAAANGVAYTGRGGRKTYNFTEADIERFRQRPKPGRRWPEKASSNANTDLHLPSEKPPK